MNYKPTEEDLIAYLYNELSNEEKSKIEQYLTQNPEEKERLQALQATRMIFNQYEDVEPPIDFSVTSVESNSNSTFWQKYIVIAATLLILFTMGWLSGFQVKYNSEGLAIGFGELNQGLTQEQVAEMIYNDQLELLEYVQANLDANQDSLRNELANMQASLDPTDLVKQAFELEKEQLLGEMNELNENLGSDYREILRQIVVNFSNNIQSQRIEDLRGIQAAFTDLEEATIGKQFEIEEALEILSERIDAVANNSNNNK